MKKSIITGLSFAALGLLSMGFLGVALYYLAYPVLYPMFGDFNDWTGPDVWPAIVWASLLWPISFPVAAWFDRKRQQESAGRAKRIFLYALTLWLGAAVTWIFVVSMQDIQYTSLMSPGLSAYSAPGPTESIAPQ